MEFHKQPPLVETLKLKQGVSVTFQNGFKKESEQFQAGSSKMRKDEYNKLIES